MNPIENIYAQLARACDMLRDIMEQNNIYVHYDNEPDWKKQVPGEWHPRPNMRPPTPKFF